MNISTSSHNLTLSAELEEFVHESIRTSLRRFAEGVHSVDVFLKDVNGPKGGIDKVVIMRVDLQGRKRIVVETSDANLRAAIQRGSKRIKRVVRRQLRRSNQLFRQRLRERLRGTSLTAVHDT